MNIPHSKLIVATVAGMMSAWAAAPIHAQDTGVDLAAQRSEIQIVKTIPGERVDHGGFVVNPTPQRMALTPSQRLDVSGGVRVNLMEKSVTVSGEAVSLTKSEYELLLFLIGNKGCVVSKSAMAEHLSGEMADMLDNLNFVYTHIKNLKAKLAAAGCCDCIKTVYGMGYKWTAD